MGRNIITLLFLIVAISVFWFWTRPLLAEIDVLKVEKDSFDQALARSRELQELRDEILDKFNSVSQDDLGRLSKMLPKDAETTKLLVQLSDMSDASGGVVLNFLDVQGMVSGVTTKGSELGYQKADLRVNISAKYEDFLVFLTELQKSLRLIDVEQIDFFAGDENFYEFNINAKAYYKN